MATPAARSAQVTGRLDDVIQALEKAHGDHVKDLQAFVRIPSISSDDAFKDDVRKAAGWLADRLKEAGLENVDFVETTGHPTVVADWLHAGDDAPTLLIYGHYDVQPAHKADGWEHEPFSADVEDDRIWGRGTTDDKGQLMAHVFAAEAWLKTTGALPVNLKFVFEGEEEEGSLHFDEVIKKAGDRLDADLLIVSDSMMRDEDTPAITYSLRGLTYVQVDIQGPKNDLHSGTWGGVVWNPAEAISHMVATLKDPGTGEVLVDGFYDAVVEPTDDERRRLAAVSDPDDFFLRHTGSKALFGEDGWSNNERVGIRPTIEVNGIWGGYTGQGAKTVIPAKAHAKVSCRLVADQEPRHIAKLLESHFQRVAPPGIQVTTSLLNIGHPVRADPGHPLVQRVETALRDAFGRRPALVAEGGSIPAVADMQRELGAVPILAGFGHKDENMHAPEESFRLKNLRRGAGASARIMAELADAKGA